MPGTGNIGVNDTALGLEKLVIRGKRRAAQFVVGERALRLGPLG